MAEDGPQQNRDIVPRTPRGLVPRGMSELARQLRYRHYQHASDPRWVSFASQRHVRDIAIDLKRKQIWLATWGGVLCIAPPDAVRHTSEHGLIGNATRAVVVDDAGVIWAAGHYGGLCSLLPEENAPWRVHAELNSWTVLQMIPFPAGGIYAALRNDRGQCLVHRLVRNEIKKPEPKTGELAAKEVESMLVDRDGVLWVGNLWGLHHFRDGAAQTIETDPREICALAPGIGGGLWLGTNRGLQRWRPETGASRQPDWPLDEIVSLAEEPDSGVLWVATTCEVGRIVDSSWQPVLSSPPGPINVLRIANLQIDSKEKFETRRSVSAWVGCANGLYRVGPDECKSILTPDSEDALSNAVQCLLAKGSKVWIGTARALSTFDNATWKHHRNNGSQICDVRALAADDERLWIGTFRAGLYRWEADQCAADASMTLPLMSLTAGAGGGLWAASVDAIYYRRADGEPWQKLADPAQANLDGRLVQVICHQMAGDGALQIPTLWIGTSRGLLRYQPGPETAWVCENAELEDLSIQSLAVDPLTNHLWVGTASGLFCESAWKRLREADIRALAFGPLPEAELLVGTSEALEHWPPPGDGKVFPAAPLTTFSFAEAGLAAPEITAVTMRENDNQREIWVGSPNGVSSYRISP